MGLLKQICEGINEYKAFVETLAEKIDEFQSELDQEKRLGLYEADPYNRTGMGMKQGTPQTGGSDTIDFQAPTEPVEKPVQHPNANTGPAKRMHMVYDPATGKVVDVIKTGPQSRPPAEYVEANADQVHTALNHLNKINPKLADMLMQGSINIWIPRSGAAVPNQSAMLGLHGGKGGTTKVNMDPQRLAAAQAAAQKMSLAK